MIKIHKQLWYCIDPDRAEQEGNLAYMTHYEDNEAFNKRKSTGLSWAKPSSRAWNRETKQHEDIIPKEVKQEVIDNSPVAGIYIGSSVSRWSTSNKLFRVKDPRGFTVEVPTDNIATLLHLCTVVKGVVQEDCVWARDGNNHILLPVNSEPYLETLDKMDTIANKLISVAQLQVGDWFKVFENDTEYYYAGKVKPTWEIKPYTHPETRSSWGYYSRNYDRTIKNYGDTYEVKEAKYRYLFLDKCTYGDKKGTLDESNIGQKPKIVEVLRNEVIPDDQLLDIYFKGKLKIEDNWSDRGSDKRVLDLGRK